MSKRRHHYVPKFYLHAFGSGEKRINLFNLERLQPIRDVSIKDQCYRHRLYGPTDDLENTLMVIENGIAPAISTIRTTRKLPSVGSMERLKLFSFVALQMMRTTLVAERIRLMSQKLVDAVTRGDPDSENAKHWRSMLALEDPVLMSVHLAPSIGYAIEDLKARLICASDNQFFITSDNPVMKYNQYHEGYHVGSTGGVSRGLQLFVPLSPMVLLMLYDGWVYHAGDKGTDIISRIPDSDVSTLNMLQVVGASENVYYSDWNHTERVAECIQRGLPHRDPDPIRSVEAIDSGNERASMLASWEQTPNLHLNLSFVRMKKEAKRVPADERLKPKIMYRKDLPDEPNYGPPIGAGQRCIIRYRVPRTEKPQKLRSTS